MADNKNLSIIDNKSINMIDNKSINLIENKVITKTENNIVNTIQNKFVNTTQNTINIDVDMSTKEAEKNVDALDGKLSGIAKGSLKIFTDGIGIAANGISTLGTFAVENSATLEGMLSTLKGNAAGLLMEVLQPVIDGMENTVLPAISGYIDILSNTFKTDGLNGMIGAFAEIFANILETIASYAPQMIGVAINIIQSLITGIQENLPLIVESALSIMNSLINGIIELLPMILEIGLQLMIQLITSIAESLPTLITNIISLVINICDTLIANIPLIIDAGLQLLMGLIQGIMDNLPVLIENVPRIINDFCNAIANKFPDILAAGFEMICIIGRGLIEAIPALIENIPQIITAIVNVFRMFNWWNLGKDFITFIGQGIGSMAGSIGEIACNLGKNIINAFKNIFSGAPNIGKNLIMGIWEGILNMKDWIINLIGGFADSVVGAIKGFFGICSPSRVMRDQVGKYLAQGVGVGFELETENVEGDMTNSLSGIVSHMQLAVDGEVSRTGMGLSANSAMITGSVSDGINTPIKDGEVFIVKNYMDSEEISEYTYQKVDGKFAIAGKRVR